MASLAATVVHFMSPSGGMEKILKTVIGVFFITVLIYPLSGFLNVEFADIIEGYTYYEDGDADYSDTYGQSLEKIYNTMIDEAKNQIVSKAGSELQKTGITEYKISVKTDIDEEGSIFISGMDVYIGGEYAGMKLAAEEKLSRIFETDVNVYAGE